MELSNLGVPSAGSANVDSVQAEVETLQSLRKPAEFVEAQPVPAPDKPKRRLIPRVFQKRGEGDASAVPNMFAAAPQLNTAPEAANPVPPSMTGDQAAVKVVTTGGEPRGSAPVIAAAAANENVAEPAAIPGQRLAVEDGGKPAKDAAAPMPSVEQVNKVAFGAESRAERGSIGYGNTTKVALGTFAFHREKGDTYRKAQRWVEAADEYETALRLSPGDTGTRALLAEALANAGEGDISDVQFRKAASEAPGDARVPYRQGNVYREQKKPDLAIGAYRQAIDLDPRNKFAHNNLGVVYMEKGDYAKAAASLKRVLEIDPAYDKAMLNLGIIYDDHLGDKEQALKYYDMYVKAKGERSGEVRGWANAIRGTQQP
jgi:tetratricopeptide (TPR) repeat protein